MVGEDCVITELNEAWMRPDCLVINLPCYGFITNGRLDKIGRGVSLCIRKDIKFLGRITPLTLSSFVFE